MTCTSMLVTLVLILTFALCLTHEVEATDQFVPYVPDPSDVVLQFREENGTSYLTVSINCRSTGYDVRDWGTPVISEHNVSVNAEIWFWSGVNMPVIITKSHTYNLGHLQPAEYFFEFRVWRYLVKSFSVSVPELTLLPILLLLSATSMVALVTRKERIGAKRGIF